MATGIWTTAITAGSPLIGVALGSVLNSWHDRSKWFREHQQDDREARESRYVDLLATADLIQNLVEIAYEAQHLPRNAQHRALTANHDAETTKLRRLVAQAQVIDPAPIGQAALEVQRAVTTALTVALASSMEASEQHERFGAALTKCDMAITELRERLRAQLAS